MVYGRIIDVMKNPRVKILFHLFFKFLFITEIATDKIFFLPRSTSILTINVPITTAADNILKYCFLLFFRENKA